MRLTASSTYPLLPPSIRRVRPSTFAHGVSLPGYVLGSVEVCWKYAAGSGGYSVSFVPKMYRPSSSRATCGSTTAPNGSAPHHQITFVFIKTFLYALRIASPCEPPTEGGHSCEKTLFTFPRRINRLLRGWHEADEEVDIQFREDWI